MNISINTFCLFGNAPLDDAFTSMKKYGYTVFEQWMIPQDSVASIQRSMKAYGISLSAFCTSFFTLNDEACHDRYEAAMLSALQTAKQLSCPSLITQVGQDTGKAKTKQHDAIVKGLMRIKPILEKANVTLLVEPLNDVKDHKGYCLTSSLEGFDIIKRVNSPNIKLLFDVYHQLHMGEDVLSLIANHHDLIGHFHVAGFPDRDEKLFETYDYRPLFQFLNDHQVLAPVGLELFPSSPGQAGMLLEELRRYRYECQ